MSSTTNAVPSSQVCPETTLSSLGNRLESARRELLDLTARNRLLNTPMGRGRTSRLDIIDEVSSEVYRILVEERREMSFLPQPEPESSVTASTKSGEQSGSEDASNDPDPGPRLPQPGDDEGTEDGLPERHVDRRLQTNLDSEKLQTRLLRLFYDARAAEEEQGVNSLFLALGFLEWYEAPQSDKPRFAPLLLAPVELHRKSANARFRLRFPDEEITTNLSLQARLKGDFGLRLPDVPDVDDLAPDSYFDDVERMIAGQERWRVHRHRIVLWFFSFAKFLMFRDLDLEAWPEGGRLEEHCLLRSLLSEGFRGEPPVIDEEENLDDRLDPRELFHVVDADSSQAAAIEEIRNGRNLVIQGPPGTGKSQTITNLVAAAVAQGRTVLFVAEKLAALEVVKARLDRIGLGDMCLELHSHKANKRAVLEELGRTLELGRPRSVDFDAQAERLRALRERLNVYADQLHRPVEPFGLSPYRVMGELSRFRSQGVRPLRTEIDDLADWSSGDFSERKRLVADVIRHLQEMPPPPEHPWRGVERDRPLLPSEFEDLSETLSILADGLKHLCEATERLSRRLGIDWDWDQESFYSVRQLAVLTKRLLEAPPMDRPSLADPVWEARRDDIDALLHCGRQLAEFREILDDVVAPVAWESDLRTTRRDLAAYGRSWFRWFRRPYRDARRTLSGIFIGPPPKSLDDQLQIVDAVIAAQTAQQKLAAGGRFDDVGRSAFGSKWRGEESKWDDLANVAAWEAECCAANLRPTFRKIVARVTDDAALREPLHVIGQHLRAAYDRLKAIRSDMQLNHRSAWGAADLRAVSPMHAADRVDLWRRSLEQLGRWIVLNRRLRDLNEQGLAALVPLIHAGECDPATILDQLEMKYCEAAMRRILDERDEIARFDGTAHDGWVELFREMDQERITLARREVALAHYDGMPGGGDSGELGILRGEIKKKRRHRPIRRLLKDAGHAVQSIKPVFMMSPISLAQFLEPGMLTYDLLLIDEASQVRPVEALGAVARSRQIVVVGDDRQLPPTQFFDRIGDSPLDESDDDDSVAAADVESVLDLCQARNLPRRMLRWHYRSRHHSLIAVSNREFYDDGLFVVPSPEIRPADKGLRFRMVEGAVYDRGGSRTNRVEARAVAEAMIEHACRTPELSLGVGTFSVAQRDAILDELEILRRAHPDIETFFADASDEPWFVKNLENVQGDERDVILISVGYGRDNSGYLAMNFGPLSGKGGERRLNVLITRSRQRCEVFSSIRADDIDLRRTQSRGPAALKTFLTYAETGRMDSPQRTDRDYDSEFEVQVAAALRRYGFEVDAQVGVAGFYVDLAVIDPDRPGRYLLGIECDGASYHSARWARDRDRLRQEVLEDHGWIIHRIWSTDWFHSPEEQLRKLLTAIEDAQGLWNSDLVCDAPETGAAETVIDRHEDDGQQENSDDYVVSYTEAAFDVEHNGAAIPDVPPEVLAGVIVRIVRGEGPIHEDEVARRTATLWGQQRAGSRIVAAVGRALQWAEREGAIEQSGSFFSATGESDVPVRNRENVSSSSLRKPEMLPPMEIQAGLLHFVRSHVSATRGESARGVARMFGFRSTSQRLRSIIEAQIDDLVEKGRLTDSNGRLRVATRPADLTAAGGASRI